MFRRLRIQLTLWYVAILGLMLLMVGSLVYVLVARSLDDEIEDALGDVNAQAARIVQALPEGERRGRGRGEEGEREHEIDEDFLALTRSQLLAGSGDVFLLVLDPDGQVIANPQNAPTSSLPLLEAKAAADRTGSWKDDVSTPDGPVRLLARPVTGEHGSVLGYVVTGRSLASRNDALERLLVLLLMGSGAGLLLAGLGGLWVAELAIRPVSQAFQRQRRFIADASHELRTPIAVIQANAEALLRKARPQDREALADIAADAQHMGRLVSDLLTLAEADRGALEVRRAPMDLYDVLASAARAGKRLAEERGLDFAAEPVHATITGDADRLRELVLILVDNAVKYTEPPGRVSLRADCSDGHACVTVEDTGVGIPKEHLPRVFERFYRVDKARSRAMGGLGLGLSIARTIAEAHGGTIDIASAPGAGTRVRVTLPAVPAA
jgi:signal transduction histidine kinase